MSTHEMNVLPRDLAALLQQKMKAVHTDLPVQAGHTIIAREISAPGMPCTGRHLRLVVTHVQFFASDLMGSRIASVEHAPLLTRR